MKYVGVPISCLDGLFEVDDGHPVDVEGAFASGLEGFQQIFSFLILLTHQ